MLKKVDVVINNFNLENILNYCKNARFKVFYGPSCSFYPKYLFELELTVF